MFKLHFRYLKALISSFQVFSVSFPIFLVNSVTSQLDMSFRRKKIFTFGLSCAVRCKQKESSVSSHVLPEAKAFVYRLVDHLRDFLSFFQAFVKSTSAGSFSCKFLSGLIEISPELNKSVDHSKNQPHESCRENNETLIWNATSYYQTGIDRYQFYFIQYRLMTNSHNNSD